MAENYRLKYLKKLDEDIVYERELLNILLGNAYGGKDMSAVTDALLARFPSVRSIIEADYAEILAVDGVPEKVAAYFKTLDRIIQKCNQSELNIKSTSDCFKAAWDRLRTKDNEHVEIYFVNKSGKVTEIKSYTSDHADRVDVAVNSVLSAISSSGAYGLYFVHNHINTSATPSKSDDVTTGKIATACRMCKIEFFDHCIISTTGDKFSYRESGKLAEIEAQLKY